jgi:cellulose synthase/poly-beta-1,6-N-acetylglucosamine synthase-like glycosyltransferase
MTPVLTVLVFVCFAMVAYAYVGYPLLLLALTRVRELPLERAETEFPVTLIITAHNEEDQIEEKLENTLALDYPRDSLQIVVASDGSTDRTDEIVRSYADRGVELVPVTDRKGKENAQREAIGHARGDIIVFSDAGTRLDPDGVRMIVRSFADPQVGCVSSEDRVIGREGKIESEGVYVRYEMALRRLETRVCSLVGLSGSFFAARREVCQDWKIDIPSDFNTVAAAIRQGYRGVNDPAALGYYLAVSSQGREFRRKVRTVLRGMAAFFANRDLWNPFRYGLFTWEIVSHKLLRWAVPVWLILAFVLSIVGAFDSVFLRWLLVVQVFGYLVAALGIAFPVLHRIPPVKILSFFVLVNAAIVVAWVKLVRGERAVKWSPSKRERPAGEPAGQGGG